MEKHPISEQKIEPKRLLIEAGQKTGNHMILPNKAKVYSNEFIVAGIPLTWGECTKDCSRVPESMELVNNAIRLAQAFGLIRAKFGGPIAVTSGYRPPRVNRAVGGASQSQHLFFKALDIYPVNGDMGKLWEVVTNTPQIVGIGDGRRKGFIHIDIRTGNHVIFGY